MPATGFCSEPEESRSFSFIVYYSGDGTENGVMGGARGNAHGILVAKSEGKRPLGRPRNR
jgi:hypothetical protein